MPDKAKQNEKRILLYSREKLELNNEEEKRWKKTTNDFTDLNQPTNLIF